MDPACRAGLKVDIKFGMPKLDCRFHGICKLDLEESDFHRPGLPECGMGKGWLFIPHPAYCLICIDKRLLSDRTRNVHFAGQYFRMAENVPFSIELTKKIGSQWNLIKGRYRILEKEGFYAVLFEVCRGIEAARSD